MKMKKLLCIVLAGGMLFSMTAFAAPEGSIFLNGEAKKA